MTQAVLNQRTSSEAQRAIALRNANRVRKLRAQLKGEIKQVPADQARCLVADAIRTVPAWLASVPVVDVVTLTPTVAMGRARWMLAQADVSEQRLLREMTCRQRQRLRVAESIAKDAPLRGRKITTTVGHRLMRFEEPRSMTDRTESIRGQVARCDPLPS